MIGCKKIVWIHVDVVVCHIPLTDLASCIQNIIGPQVPLMIFKRTSLLGVSRTLSQYNLVTADVLIGYSSDID